METSQGAVPRKSRRRTTWILVGAVLVASAVGGGWLSGPTVMDALRKAAALTDALLAKVMWTLCGTGFIAPESREFSLPQRGADRPMLWVMAIDARPRGTADVPHDVFDVLAKSLGDPPDVLDPPLTTNAATAAFGI